MYFKALKYEKVSEKKLFLSQSPASKNVVTRVGWFSESKPVMFFSHLRRMHSFLNMVLVSMDGGQKLA